MKKSFLVIILRPGVGQQSELEAGSRAQGGAQGPRRGPGYQVTTATAVRGQHVRRKIPDSEVNGVAQEFQEGYVKGQ